MKAASRLAKFVIIMLCAMRTAQCLRCRNDAWPCHDPEPPRYIVNLDLEPEDRWSEIMLEYKDVLNSSMEDLKYRLAQNYAISNETFKLFEQFVVEHIGPKLPDQYIREIRAISRLTDIHEAYIITANVVYEFAALCTTAIKYDPVLDDVLHLRNLDFGPLFGWDKENHSWAVVEYMQSAMLDVDFQRGSVTVFRGITYAGFVGILTGMAPNRFAVSVNARFAMNGGFMGLLELITETNVDQSFITLAVRDVLSDPSNNYEKAVSLFSTIDLVAPVYFTISGIKPSEGCVLARARARLDDKWELLPNSSDLRQKLIVQTNYDRTHEQPIFDNRVDPVYRCYQRYSDKRQDVDRLFNIFSSIPLADEMTAQTNVMAAKSNMLQTFIRSF